MKKAFTLIELLVVIAEAKQIGTGFYIYINDFDDVLPPYRINSSVPINPTYLQYLASGDPRAATFASQGSPYTLDAEFVNQLVAPYVKSDDIWKAPTNPNAWVNYQDKGTWDPGFFAYGGQNSYAMNNYVFRPTGSPYSTTSLAEPSNTLLIVDATYYNALPAEPTAGFCKIGGYDPTNGNPASSYMYYWKQLGNSALNFESLGSPNPDDPSNVATFANINARYNGLLNVVRGDTSAKALNSHAVVTNLTDNVLTSYWNPLKTACE
jgi:hypothetical protein